MGILFHVSWFKFKLPHVLCGCHIEYTQGLYGHKYIWMYPGQGLPRSASLLCMREELAF